MHLLSLSLGCLCSLKLHDLRRAYLSLLTGHLSYGTASGSKFIAMKTAVEQVESLWYKLRMFGVPLEGPTNMFCDNEAVFKNASIPDSTLKKKHTSICYHRCRKAVASRTVRVGKEGTLTNLSDLFTKPMPQAKHEAILDHFTY